MSASMPPAALQIATLNLGSGKDFRADCFNVDVDDTWTPDAVLDFSNTNLTHDGIALETQRFGSVLLTPGCFDRIIANDVLEHVPALTKLMSTCLSLLRTGGVFEISVPYDLSFGAWQDPTHVRAFNERSWLYYTDWFWYLGWSEARFQLQQLNFILSASGRKLKENGINQDTIMTTPRAIDSMSVVLRKVELSLEDQSTWDHWRERRRLAKIANVESA